MTAGMQKDPFNTKKPKHTVFVNINGMLEI